MGGFRCLSVPSDGARRAVEWCWWGRSKRSYLYVVHGLDATLACQPGNFIAARRQGRGWDALYIGESDDLSTIFERSPGRRLLIARQATHIHTHVSSRNACERRAEQCDLLINLAPLRGANADWAGCTSMVGRS
ncbi:MAG: hypothetical protein IPK66_04155 [Rhodospirillales bacterium]|nr:hypothetical protein [Rhodospirillales bacterium]